MQVPQSGSNVERPDPQAETDATHTPAQVTVTRAAADKIRELLRREGRSDLRLRIAVQPGGCSGLRYQLFFDDRLFGDDAIVRISADGKARQLSAELASGHDRDSATEGSIR